jgi:hypothetical protein
MTQARTNFWPFSDVNGIGRLQALHMKICRKRVRPSAPLRIGVETAPENTGPPERGRAPATQARQGLATPNIAPRSQALPRNAVPARLCLVECALVCGSRVRDVRGAAEPRGQCVPRRRVCEKLTRPIPNPFVPNSAHLLRAPFDGAQDRRIEGRQASDLPCKLLLDTQPERLLLVQGRTDRAFALTNFFTNSEPGNATFRRAAQGISELVVMKPLASPEMDENGA